MNFKIPTEDNTEPENIDILVVGASVSALSSTYHLLKNGFSSVKMLAPPHPPSPAEDELAGPPRAVFTSPLEPITRIDHQYGLRTVKEWTDYLTFGKHLLLDFLEGFEIDVKETWTRRIALTKIEGDELRTCKSIWKTLGTDPKIYTWNKRTVLTNCETTLSFDLRKFESLLRSEVSQTVASGIVTGIEEKEMKGETKLWVTTSTKKVYTTEAVVLACHTNIRDILPFYKSVFFSKLDQWSEIYCDNHPYSSLQVNMLKFGNHWFLPEAHDKIIFGGANYLRKTHNLFDKETLKNDSAHINQHLIAEIRSLDPSVNFGQLENPHYYLTMRPCDEKPVIGPHFGSSRIYVCGGYMGTEPVLGFAAGHSVATLIRHGICADLPRSFYPERFRTLPQNTQK